MEHFQGTEVELDLESAFVQRELPRSRQPFHILVRLDEAPSFVLDVQVALQCLRAISCVSDDDTFDIFVRFAEELSVVGVRRREHQRENPSVIIARHGHFEPEVEAFSGVAPRGQSSHRAVPLAVFLEAHGDIGRVGELHEVRVPSSQAHDDEQNPERDDGSFVHGGHERGVRTVE